MDMVWITINDSLQLSTKLDDNNEFEFELNITDQVFYTRDSHLAIKVIDSEPGSNPDAFGIMGKIVVKSSESIDPPSD